MTIPSEIPSTLRHALDEDRMASAYLFYGRDPLSFEEPIQSLIQAMTCTETSQHYENCGSCRDCRQAKSLNHPDVTAPGAPGSEDDLGTDDRIGVDTVRTKILDTASLTPARSQYKIFWLHDLDRFTTEASNTLLKVLEEPPGNAVFFLTSRSRWDCLATIRSRCQWIRIPPDFTIYDSFEEKYLDHFDDEIQNKNLFEEWIDLLNGKSKSSQFNWNRTTSRQFLEFIILLIDYIYTESSEGESDIPELEDRLSYRLIPDILQRLDELERGGNPSLVVNSLLEEIFYPEEKNEWVNIT